MSSLRALLPVVAAAAVLAASGCEPEPNTPVATRELTELEADLVMLGMENQVTADGVRTGRVVSDTAYVFEDSSEVHMVGVDMTLYHEDGRQRAHITAERGRLNQRTERMIGRGNVVVRIAEGGQVIRTEELHYDPQRDEIWSDSATAIEHEGGVTRGSCFRSDLQLRNRRLCDIRGAAGVNIRESPGDTVAPESGGSGGDAPDDADPGGGER